MLMMTMRSQFVPGSLFMAVLLPTVRYGATEALRGQRGTYLQKLILHGRLM